MDDGVNKKLMSSVEYDYINCVHIHPKTKTKAKTKIKTKAKGESQELQELK